MSRIRLAVMVAIGIGLHNLGGGLVIGSAYAVGELALGAASLGVFGVGVGVGAIVQVIIQIVPGLHDSASGRLLDPAVIGGPAAGAVIMYATGLLVAA